MCAALLPLLLDSPANPYCSSSPRRPHSSPSPPHHTETHKQSKQACPTARTAVVAVDPVVVAGTLSVLSFSLPPFSPSGLFDSMARTQFFCVSDVPSFCPPPHAHMHTYTRGLSLPTHSPPHSLAMAGAGAWMRLACPCVCRIIMRRHHVTLCQFSILIHSLPLPVPPAHALFLFFSSSFA